MMYVKVKVAPAEHTSGRAVANFQLDSHKADTCACRACPPGPPPPVSSPGRRRSEADTLGRAMMASTIATWHVDECGPLSRNLQWWLRHVTADPTGRRESLFRRTLFLLRGSKISLTVASVALVLTLLNAVTAVSFDRADVSVRYFIGVTTCLFAQILFWRRQPLLRAWLGLIIGEARRLEQAVDRSAVGEQERLARRARSGRKMRWFFVVHAACTEVTFVYTLSVVPPSWAERAVGTPLETEVWTLRWGCLALQGYGLLAGLAAIYTFIPLVLQVTMSSADLLDALARRLELSKCEPKDAAMLSRLHQACLLADATVSDITFPVVFASLLMPLISIAQALSGTVDNMDALGTAPLFMTITVPLYLVGDMLERARHGVAQSSAKGPWLDEPPRVRLLRCAIMLGADGRGALLRCGGLGLLNRQGLVHVMRSWGGFLQAMANLRRANKQV